MRERKAWTAVLGDVVIARREVGGARGHMTEHAKFKGTIVAAKVEAGEIKVEEAGIVRVEETTWNILRKDGSRLIRARQ